MLGALLITALMAAAELHAVSFQAVAPEAGFVPPFSANIPAGGIAVADFNRDGWPDVFVTGYLQPNRLFFNQGDGTFVQSEAINSMLAGALCSVVAAADFDNDGWTDLYIGCRGGQNLLLRNLEGTGFADVTPAELDHNPGGSNPPRTDALAWGDFTGNGHLDLYIGIYPNSAHPDIDNPDNLDRIALNHGDGSWSLALVDADAPMRARLARTALAATIQDFTGDGRQDLLVINDKLQGNSLWRNDGPGCGGWCFTDIAADAGVLRPLFGMGIAVGDVDRDGHWDLYASSIDEQTLFRGTGSNPSTFIEDADSPLNHYGVGWGTIFADFDNDGWEDAFLAVASAGFSTTGNQDQIYRNLGQGEFVSVSAASGLAQPRPTQAAARIDFDRDGRIDLVLGHWNEGYRLYHNVTPAAGRWLGLHLEGGGTINRDAAGSRIVLRTAGGCQMRELRIGESRGSSHEPGAHFGLGSAGRGYATVYWPDGSTEVLGWLSADQYHQHAIGNSIQHVFAGDFEIDPCAPLAP